MLSRDGETDLCLLQFDYFSLYDAHEYFYYPYDGFRGPLQSSPRERIKYGGLSYHHHHHHHHNVPNSVREKYSEKNDTDIKNR